MPGYCIIKDQFSHAVFQEKAKNGTTLAQNQKSHKTVSVHRNCHRTFVHANVLLASWQHSLHNT